MADEHLAVERLADERPLVGRTGVERLAVYGTLRPGRANHHHVSQIPGRWLTGVVRGHLVQAGWGAGMGFPGITLDPTAPQVAVDIVESAELHEHWQRLDAFEGPGYVRTRVAVSTHEGAMQAWIYALA